MARASYIYLVMELSIDIPIGAFTVKHEMVTFLKNEAAGYCMPERQLSVYRVPDGGNFWGQRPDPHYTELDVLELLKD